MLYSVKSFPKHHSYSHCRARIRKCKVPKNPKNVNQENDLKLACPTQLLVKRQ